MRCAGESPCARNLVGHATDGYAFRIFGRQHGETVLQRALADPDHRWHEIASEEGEKRYLSDSVTLVSRDGLHWELKTGGHWDWGHHAAQSFHPGGVICGLGDGSVRFIAETINAGNSFAPQPNPNGGGLSPYGVWGALGSKNGGESPGDF